jgi:hypothetical protein
MVRVWTLKRNVRGLKLYQGFRVTQGFDLSLLEGEVNQLRCSLTTMSSQDLMSSLASVEDARQEIESHPLGATTLLTARLLNDRLGSSLDCQGSLLASVRIHRQGYIRAQAGLWTWLEGDIRTTAISYLNRGRPHSGSYTADTNWLNQLVDSIKAMVLDRTAAKAFVASTFGIRHNPPILRECVLVNRYRQHYYVDGDPALEQIVPRLASFVISTWLGNDSDLEQKRAWFITTIIDLMGEEILTTDFLWNMLVNFRPIYALPRSIAYGRADGQGHLQPLIEAVSRHPINTPGSREHTLYQAYRGLLQGKISPHDTMQPLSSASRSWQALKDMISLSLEYLSNPQGSFSHPFMLALQEEPDYYLPFREQAPSRIASRSSTGPYHGNIIMQKKGLFSAAIWRGCTYRSGFARERGIGVFENSFHLLDEVDAVIRGSGGTIKGRDSTYFCRKNAYGQPAGGRCIEVCSVYWSCIEEFEWADFSRSNPTFVECMEAFRPPGKEASRFPQLGPLGALLLTGDMAYAGVCQKPTDMECARLMLKVDRGGLGGLKRLGLAPEPLPSRTGLSEASVEAIRDGLQELYDGVRRLLASLGFTDELDFILLEHMLCKLQRAFSDRLFT